MNRIRAAIASALAVACLVGGTVTAVADPDAVAKAQAELERIQQESSAIDQEIIEAHERVAQGETKLTNLKADVARQEQQVSDLAAQMGEQAAVALEVNSFSLTAQLLTSSDSDSFLRGLGAMQVETDRSNAAVQQLQLDQAKLTTLREDATATQAQLEKDAAAKEALAVEFDAKEAEAQRVYDRLSEEERQRLAAIEAERIRRAEEQQRQAEARAAAGASRDEDRGTSESPSATAPSEEPPAASGGGSDRAQAAVSAALSKVGSRYVWGTSGPNTFDCSGLTSWAYRQVGISLSRSSRAQWSSAGRKISKSELQPGDLVFYYSPVSHVGLYIGNGKIVDAANPRSGVRVTSLNSMPFTGARRVVG